MTAVLSRRKFLVGIAGLAGASALAACAPKEPTAAPAPAQPKAAEETKPAAATKPTDAPKPAAKDVEVRYMSWWGAFNTGPYPEIIKDFQDAYPNVTVKLEEVPYGEAQTKYQTTLVSGTAADILYHMNFMSQYYVEDLILDITPRFDADGLDFENDFYHGLGLNEWAGKIYGFPHMYETCLMLYNKTMIKEHWGKDLWEAFPDGNMDLSECIEIAKACTIDTNGDGRFDQWGMYIYHRSYYYGMETQGWTRGDSIFDVQNMKYNFTSDIIKQVNHDLFDWVRKDGFVISEEDLSEVNKASGAGAPFFAGLTAMRVRMNPDVGRGLSTIGDKFEWDLFHLPNYNGRQAVTRAGGHGHNIAKSTKVPDEAWELCKFMGTSPGMKYNAESKLSVPVYRKDPSLRAAFEKGEPEHLNVVMDVLEKKGGYGDHLRFHNEGEALNMFKNELDLLYNEPYEDAKAKMDDVMAKLEKDMNEIVNYGDTLPFPDLEFPFPPPK